MTGRRSLQRLAVVAVGALVLSACGSGGEDGSGGGSGGEVIREPVDEVGPDPFTESVAESVSAVTATTLVAAGVDGSDLGSVRGSSEAVYGGSLDEGECDADRLVGFLEENPDKAEAWASVQGIAVSGIAGFVADLTPMVLRQDTRVTNHGFRDGRATPRQSVFEAGTAVLVDQRGVPRVRCGCGNPLAEPEPTATAPRFTGPSWSGFHETTLVVIIEGDTVNQFTLVDVDTDERFLRPAGTSGDQDDLVEPEPPPTTSTTEPPPPPTTAPPPPPPPTTAAPPSFGAFAGLWEAHTGSLTVGPDGQSQLSYAIGCCGVDAPFNTLTFQLTSVQGDTASGTIQSSSTPGLPEQPGVPIAVTLLPGGQIGVDLSDGGITLCGPQAVPGSCGA